MRGLDITDRMGYAEASGVPGGEGLGTAGFRRLRGGNTRPGRVFFTVDFRHPDEATLAKMDREVREDCQVLAAEGSLALKLHQIWHFLAAPFHLDCVAAVRYAVVRRANEQGD